MKITCPRCGHEYAPLAPAEVPAPGPAFKVGDRVRYVGGGGSQWPPISMKLVGTVWRIGRSGRFGVHWPAPMEPSDKMFYSPRRLEPAPVLLDHVNEAFSK